MEFGEIYKGIGERLGNLFHRKPAEKPEPIFRMTVTAKSGNPTFELLPELLQQAPLRMKIQIIFIADRKELKRDEGARVTFDRIQEVIDRRNQALMTTIMPPNTQ